MVFFIVGGTRGGNGFDLTWFGLVQFNDVLMNNQKQTKLKQKSKYVCLSVDLSRYRAPRL